MARKECGGQGRVEEVPDTMLNSVSKHLAITWEGSGAGLLEQMLLG